MNKNEAVIEMAKLEERAAILRAIITAPESLLNKPITGSCQPYWSIGHDFSVGFRPVECAARLDTDYASTGNMFLEKKSAEDYAKAINTMLLLRRQPGTVPVEAGKAGWSVEMLSGVVNRYEITPYVWQDTFSQCNKISPIFSTQLRAGAAIYAMGKDNLIHMFKTLHHIED